MASRQRGDRIALEQALGRDPGLLGDELDHRAPRPGWCELDRLAAVLDRRPARHVARQAGEHLLGEDHEVLVRRIGLIELEHGELGVVARRETLVAEDARELEDPLEPSDDEPLQVQLGRDAQVEVDAEGVVVRGEGAGHGPPGDGLHHRRLHLDVAARVEEAADLRDHRAAGDERAAHLGVGHEVEVALAIARLHVGEAVPLLGRRQQCLRQERQLSRLHRQLALSRPHDPARHPDVIAEVDEVLEHRVCPLAEVVLAEIDLQAALAVGERGEGDLALRPFQHDPTRDLHGHGQGLQLLQRLLPVGGDDLAEAVGTVEPVRVGIDAALAQRVRLGETRGRLLRPALHRRLGRFGLAHAALIPGPDPATAAPPHAPCGEPRPARR